MSNNIIKCPFCAEVIQADEDKCKFCEEDLSASINEKVNTSKMGLMKKCPSCKEEIKQDANKCKHCGEIQDTLESKKQIQQQKHESAKEEGKKAWANWWSWLIGIVAIWFLLGSDWYWDLFF
jgi:hypothetical protein|tara:strand:- start:75 stop:440 length:366 start_codon:yes stop_codon:yes gene_type:complete